jgi:hypothetical protein
MLKEVRLQDRCSYRRWRLKQASQPNHITFHSKMGHIFHPYFSASLTLKKDFCLTHIDTPPRSSCRKLNLLDNLSIVNDHPGFSPPHAQKGKPLKPIEGSRRILKNDTHGFRANFIDIILVTDLVRHWINPDGLS